MHHFKLSCLQSAFNKLFIKLGNIHSYNTRQKHFKNIQFPLKTLATGQKYLAYRGIKIWKTLHPNLKVQPFCIFKKKYKLHLLSQY